MNCKEHNLPELELMTGQVREALQCILHTILFVRSPGPVTPQDTELEFFQFNYTKIANEAKLEKRVDDAIESFLRSLSQIGPELLSGCLTLSFFERTASRQLFGLVKHEERVVFEQWILRVVVNNTPRPISNDSAAVIERQRIQDMGEGMLRDALQKVFESAGGPIDHVPPCAYDFEIHCSKRIDDRENVITRVANMPSLINLGN